ncbi:MAG: hypothetical protein HGA85_03730, partial [Nanoarchaeota archaeon]|nr:hypothetical protein [Nanoarchaeota archaeon]
YSVELLPGKSENFDIIGDTSFSLGDLNPGEKVTLTKERIRPKRLGKRSIGASTLIFLDNKGRRFNKTSVSPEINVEEADPRGPLLIYRLETESTTQIVGRLFNITTNLTNIGSSRAEASVNGKTVLIPLYESRQVIEETSYDAPGIYTIPSREITYLWDNKKVTAYSNSLQVRVIDPESPKSVPDLPPVKEEEAVPEEVPKKDENFIMKFFTWLGSLFKGK